MNAHPARNSLCYGVPGPLLHHGELESGYPLDETSYRKDCGYRYFLFYPGVACQNNDNWNGAVLVRKLIPSASF